MYIHRAIILIMVKQANIYTLTDPRTNEIKYVGCTTRPEQRRRALLYGGLQHSAVMSAWRAEVFASGLEPVFQVVEKCLLKSSKRREQAWMDQLREEGHDLLNQRPATALNLDHKKSWGKRVLYRR